MTSVAVVSSAVARINCLKELLQNLPKETDELLKSLEGIKELLAAAEDANAELEKEIVRLSYDIVDAIADASSSPKDMFSGKLAFMRTSGTAKIKQLQEKLSGFHAQLKRKNQESTEVSPDGNQNTASSSTPSLDKKVNKPNEKPTVSKLNALEIKKQDNTMSSPGSEVPACPEQNPEVSRGSKNQAGPKQPIYKEKSIVSQLIPWKKKNSENIVVSLSSKFPSGLEPSPKVSPASENQAGPEQRIYKEKSIVSQLIPWKKKNSESTMVSLSTEVPSTPEVNPAGSPALENQGGRIYKERSIVSQLIPWMKKNSDNTTISLDSEVPSGSEQSHGVFLCSEDQAGPKQNPRAEEKVGTDVEMLPHLKESLKVSNVVYIVGESGMGKSTLARKLFHDLQFGSPFNVCAWVPINQNFQIKRVLQVLLQKLGPRQELDMRDMNETELISQIFAVLKNKSYLLVLDDIWAVDDWESIRLALPIVGRTRIIITTSSKRFTELNHSHEILGMTQHHILALLKKKANFKHDSEEVGKAIYDISSGSPLLATILGKSLQLDTATTSQHQLVDDLRPYRTKKGTPSVLGACYKRLAHELKPCLIYLGLFPQGQDIEVEKLYLLLTAENLLLSPKESQISLPYLIDQLEALARRKLVEVQEDIVSTRGNNKSYRLHDQVLEFCKFKGLEEEFIESVDVGSSTKVGLHARRLAIYFSKSKAGNYSIQFDSEDTLKKILSLMIFDTSESAEEESDWPSEINDLREFTHLRILNFDGVDFINVRNIPRGLDRLVLLRYLSFRSCVLEELPSSLSSLTQLETLDLVVQADCNVFIPKKVLTNMKRMMHLYFPLMYYSNGKLQLQSLERLEILVNFNTEVCEVKALLQFKKLKILSTMTNEHTENLDIVIDFINERGDKLQHSSVDIRSSDYYNTESISAVEKLLDCKFAHSINIEGQIGDIPGEHNRAEKVADMVLNGSEFEDDPMDYLGRFENLQSLVLKNDAFVGSEIVIAAAAPHAPLFRNLRSLKLQNLQYLEKLTIQRGAMPNLSTLQIESCDCLQELSIPKELDEKLRKEQGDYRGDAYSIMPLPPRFNIISP